MLSQVVEGESQVHFRMHQFLARENGKPEALFYLQEGWACRYRLLSDGRRQITALYLPGDYCDPQWVLGGVSSQPVVAITNVRALRFLESLGRDDRASNQLARVAGSDDGA